MADLSPGAPIAIPALTFRSAGGSVDLASTVRYAEHAAGMPTRYFLVSGTTGRGRQATVRERAQILEAWCGVTGPDRLLAACWQPEDLRATEELGILPVLVIQDCRNTGAVLDLLRAGPDGCWVYSHPRYSPVTFTPDVAFASREAGLLPGGAKVSKVTLQDLLKLRSITGSDFALWHGSSRDITGSLMHGATGVVSAPLSSLPPLPSLPAGQHDQYADEAQCVVDQIQRILDSLNDSTGQIDFLLAAACRTLGIRRPQPGMPAGVKQAAGNSENGV
jgi:dihydrodipicolinate synthase/N-acetylneuraminate lyase